MERASYASDPETSRGRLYPTGASPSRSEFQRDRDRIIHAAAFRRLQYKTQVFLRHEGQHFRTRLTHTLEVSQMARSIARSLRLDEDLAEAVALAHDLGHTPFGHAGERVLHHKMERFGGFDHNMQALRVVTLLENRYAEHDGLNLTWETLEGILKHNGPVADVSGLRDIPVPSDLEPTSYAGLEAQAAAIADDIAYNSHDIDDAIRAGLLRLDDLADVALAGPFVREVLEHWPGIDPSRQSNEVQRRLITAMIVDVLATSTALIEKHAPKSADEVRAAGETLIRFSEELGEGEQALKRFMFDNVYRSHQVMEPVERSEVLVGQLFDTYLAGAPMPGRWRQAFIDAADERAAARVVADFIAGMTDPYAEQEHARVVSLRV